jgi:predicted AlkP superfamily pyrophosphatase or phosphodiesterase
VVVSIDGLRPEYYLDERFPTPALRQLYHQGSHARAVRTIFPSYTYPGHATLVTGALPARHGVVNNRAIEPIEEKRWLSDASDIRVPALWDAVRAAGGTTAALNWPLTKGAPIDWNVPDVWPGSDDKLMQATRDASTPSLLDELEREATGRLRLENFSSRLIAHDVRLATMAAYLYERHRPTLTLVHCESAVQVQQEPGWRNPRRPRALAAADLVVSLLLEQIERDDHWKDTAFLVTGDHGMSEVHTALRPNIWLIEAGLRPAKLDDNPWRATLHALGGAAVLRVQPPHQQNADAARQVLDSQPAALRATYRIVERPELDALGADPDAPFALAAAPGFVIDERTDPPLLQANVGMSHGHHPDDPEMNTGLILAGAGVRPGVIAPSLPLTSIAPLVAALLGLDFHAPDGEVYAGFVED